MPILARLIVEVALKKASRQNQKVFINQFAKKDVQFQKPLINKKSL